ncbi:MAG: hypothetical protein ACREM1_02720 [Longimicrobiales bacterium]
MPADGRAVLLARAWQLKEEVHRRLLVEPAVAAVTFADRVPGMNHPNEAYRIESDRSASA